MNSTKLRPTWDSATLGQDGNIFINTNMATAVRVGQASVGFQLLSSGLYLFRLFQVEN